MAKAKRDRLSQEEVQVNTGTIYEPGLPYQWVLSYGWVMVGFYCGHISPVRIRVAHANYYQSAGKTHAELAQEGASKETTWRYIGKQEITTGHILFTNEYHGEVPRGKVQFG